MDWRTRIAAGSGAGACAGATAALVDLRLARFPIAAEPAWAAVAGAALAMALLAVLPCALLVTLLGSRRREDHAADWLLASAAGLGLALLCVGVLYATGAALGEEYKYTMNDAALTLPPLAAVLGGLATRALVGARTLRLRTTGAALWWAALCAAAVGWLGAEGGSTLGAWLGGAMLLALGLLAARNAPRFVGLGALAALGAGLAMAWPTPRLSPAPQQPRAVPPGSVVVVVLDTVRADHLGPYGGPADATPALDRIAAEGAVFEQMISTSPWTVPSHASMFTGLAPRSHGVHNGSLRRLDDSFVTTAERLSQQGYETAAFAANGWLRIANLLQGFETRGEVYHLPYERLVMLRLLRYLGVGWELWVDQGAAEALEAVDGWLRKRSPDRPFFLFLNLFEAHAPYLPPIAYRERGSTSTYLDEIRAVRAYSEVAWHTDPMRHSKRADRIRALYEGEIRYQDRRLGELVELLGRHLRLDDLTLIVTADHGENLGDGERWGHVFELDDSLIHVPFIVRSPAHFAAGTRIAEQQQLLDLHATLLDLAGLEGGEGAGHSLLPDARRPHPLAFSEYHPDLQLLVQVENGSHPGRGVRDLDTTLQAVRGDGFKLVMDGRGRTRLYALASDPMETHDLAARHPAKVAELRAALAGWLARTPARALPRDAATGLNPETREQLRALGYAQ